MNTHQYLAAFRKGWYVILIAALVGTIGGWGITHVATKVYTATSSLYFSLSTGAGGDANDINQGSTYTQNQMLSFAQLANSTIVLKPVIEELGLSVTPAELAKTITVSTPQSTVILDLSASDQDARQSARITNAVAQSLASTVQEIAPRGLTGKSTVEVRVIQPAVTPVGPSSPNEKLNILAGLLLGLIVGVLILVLRELLETRVQSEAIATELTGSPILGSIRQEKRRVSGELVLVRDPLSNAAEAYRQLRSNLEYVAIGSKTLCLVITSSIQGEGKSTIAANLALALSEGGQRVLLVDADLRRPAIASYTGLEGEAGLTTVLVGRAHFSDVVQRWGTSGLDVLTSGTIPPNPSEILSSKAMAELLGELREQYDVILLDTAPLAAVADAAILAPTVDGALVIADRTKVHRHQLTQTMQSLRRSGATVLGLVINRVAPAKSQGSYYYRAEPTGSGLGGRAKKAFTKGDAPESSVPRRHSAGSDPASEVSGAAAEPAASDPVPTAQTPSGDEPTPAGEPGRTTAPVTAGARGADAPTENGNDAGAAIGSDDIVHEGGSDQSEDYDDDDTHELVTISPLDAESADDEISVRRSSEMKRPSAFRNLSERALRNNPLDS